MAESAASAASAQPARRGAVALDKTLTHLVWLIPTLQKFPKSQRFLLGDRLSQVIANRKE